LIENNFINAAHDVSDGGLYTALVEMGMPGLLGFDIVSDSEIRMDAFLFGEAQGRILVSLVEEDEDNFLDYIGEQGISCTLLGHVTKGKIHVDGDHFGFINEAKNTFDTSLEKRMAAI
jgi:phosphoribosylformylglycinamidine synthase